MIRHKRCHRYSPYQIDLCHFKIKRRHIKIISSSQAANNLWVKLTHVLNERKAIIIIFLSYVLLFSYQRYYAFNDEIDNILGGMSVTHGIDIYKGYFSQHTPFVYYLTSIFSFLGAHQYETYRIGMSIVLLLTWIFIYLFYKKDIGKNTILLFIFLYSLTMNYFFGFAIMADIFEGFALVILLIELLNYAEKKNINTVNMIVVSLCVFISIMSAFVSVYPLLFVLIGFIAIELSDYRNILNKKWYYLKFILIIIAPFIIIFGWYAYSGNLMNFYLQAYRFNAVYYSKYLNGFGASASQAFIQGIMNWFKHIIATIADYSSLNALSRLLVVFNIIYLYQYGKKNLYLAVILFFFLGFTGIRTYNGFHAAPYYLISLLFIAIIINKCLIKKEILTKNYQRILIGIMTALLFIVAFINYLPYSFQNFNKPIGYMSSSPYDPYIQRITGKDDKIWITGFYTQAYIHNFRQPASRITQVHPWFVDAYNNNIISDLENNKPILIIFNPDADIWGYKYANFASQIYSYIKSNYTILNPHDPVAKNIYILNSDYNYAAKQMWPGGSTAISH
jgi:hypothetical protein